MKLAETWDESEHPRDRGRFSSKPGASGASADSPSGSPQTKSPAFRTWFRESKVVDPEGQPLVVYHGTGGDHESYSLDKASQTDSNWFGRGFYFSPDPDIANQYAYGKAPNVRAVYLSIQNPADWRDVEGGSVRGQGDAGSLEARQRLIDQGYDGVFVYDDVVKSSEPASDEVWGLVQSWYRENKPGMRVTRQMLDTTLAHGAPMQDFIGYFGPEVAKRLPKERTLREVVAFYPEQIKSATGNRGTFDPDSPVVTESQAEWDESKHPRDKGRFASKPGTDQEPNRGKPTDSAAFKNWFRQSKAVDASGQPLRVYHGTDQVFDTFDPTQTTNTGNRIHDEIYFTDDPASASEYSRRLSKDPEFQRLFAEKELAQGDWTQLAEEVNSGGKGTEIGGGWGKLRTSPELDAAYVKWQARLKELEDYMASDASANEGANVLPAYLSMQNPLEIDARGESWSEVNSDAVQQARRSGADGVIIRNVLDHANPQRKTPMNVYIVFRPQQIKSASGNRGTFDPESPKITESLDARCRRMLRQIREWAQDGPRFRAQILEVAAQCERRVHELWNPEEHPRGHEGNPGQFAHKGGPQLVTLRGVKHEVQKTEDGWEFRRPGKKFWVSPSKETAAEIERQMQAESPDPEEPPASVTPEPTPAPAAKPEPPAADTPWTGAPIRKGEVYNIPVSQLRVDPTRFQFKIKVNAQGVTDEFKKVAVWNPDFAGVLAVWRDPADMQTYVVNGHHRYELAARLNVDTLAIRYIEAADAKTARAKGALINIAEGRGTAVDAAKFMRDTGQTVEDFKAVGVSLSGRVAAEAIVLRTLSDETFGRIVRGSLDADTAVAVAKELPNPELQDQLFRLLEKRDDDGKDTSLRVISEMAREMAQTPTTKTTERSLFGDIESENSLFVPRNELKAAIRGDLSREVHDFLAVASKRRAEAVAGAGNVLNLEENKRIAEEADRVLQVYDTLVNRKGAISDAINAGAEEYSKAKKRADKNAIRKRTTEAVRDAVLRESESLDAGGTGRSLEGCAGVPARPAGDSTAADGVRRSVVAARLKRRTVLESRIRAMAAWNLPACQVLILEAAGELERLACEEWSEEDHPRGHEGNPGQFAHKDEIQSVVLQGVKHEVRQGKDGWEFRRPGRQFWIKPSPETTAKIEWALNKPAVRLHREPVQVDPNAPALAAPKAKRGVTVGGQSYGAGEPIPQDLLSQASYAEATALRGEHPRAQALGKARRASRVGKGKQAELVMADGKPVPDHVTPQMIPPAWKRVKIYDNPQSDVWVEAVDDNKRTKRVYNPAFEHLGEVIKFARVADMLHQSDKIHAEIQAARQRPQTQEEADVVWLMEQQATRPGSDADARGLEAHFGVRLRPEDFDVRQSKKGEPSVVLKLDGKQVPITSRKTKLEILRRIDAGEPLLDSDFWLGSTGATTLQARHVRQDEDGTVRLQFVGKEGVWHDHPVVDPDLGKMLLRRKQEAERRGGPKGNLFATDERLVKEFCNQLDGGQFTAKDFRTKRANELAVAKIRSMAPPSNQEELERAVQEVGEHVAETLGNDAQQALESYVNREVFVGWIQGIKQRMAA